MGYDMHTVAEDHNWDDDSYFRANIWGMQMLRGAMKAANVLDTDYDDPEWPEVKQEEGESEEMWDARREEMCAPIRAFRSEKKGLVPIGKFCSNDGWHIVPEECLIIADALDKLLTSDQEIFYRDSWEERTISLSEHDKQFVKEFANYCRRASSKKGFRVW